MNEYKNNVRKNFIPKNIKARTIEHRQVKKSNSKNSFQSHREVKRYRYFKGVAYG